MVDFGKLDKMIKISGYLDKLNTTGIVVIFRPLLTEEFHIYIYIILICIYGYIYIYICI